MENRILSYKVFRGNGDMPWDRLFDAAVRFANEVGPDRVLNISHTADGGCGTAVVWFWAEKAAETKG